MILKFLLALLIVLSSFSLSIARAQISGIAARGAEKIVTVGVSSATLAVRAFPGASITVYITGTTTLAAIYSDNLGTTKSNPFAAGSDASWSFYVDNGAYDVRIAPVGGNPLPWTIAGLIASDPQDTLYNVKSFGAKGDSIANDTTAIQTTINTADNSPAAIVYFPSGTYKIVSTITVSNRATAGQSQISLKGDNPSQTILKWYGSTSGNMIKLWRNKYSKFEGLGFDGSGVAKGTTVGVLATGPGTGTQTNGFLVQNCLFSNFGTGFQVGEATGSHAASEGTFISCDFNNNDVGFRSVDFNSLNWNFFGCGATFNAVYAVDIQNAANMNWHGGSFGGNALGFKLSDGQYFISGIRDEVAGVNYRFVVGGGGSGNVQLTVDTCSWQTTEVLKNPLIISTGNVQIRNSRFDYSGNTSLIPFGDTNPPNNDGRDIDGSRTTLVLIGNAINQGSSLISHRTDSSGSVGLRYTFLNNIKSDAGGNPIAKWDDEIGVIVQDDGGVWARRSGFRVTASGNHVSDILLMGNQIATPTVRGVTMLRTQNSAPTTYTNFLNGSDGQPITIMVKDANTTFAHNANIVNRSGANITATNGQTYSWVNDNGVWRQIN